MSSLALRRALDVEVELWLAGLFTAAELAAADLLLQLSVAGAGGGDEAAESSSETTYSSRKSASPGLVDLTAEEGEEERAVEEPALSTELDMRARKRYRLLSDLYAATAPVTTASAAAAAAKKKRKRHHLHEDWSSSESSAEEATRYGGDY